MIATTRNEIHEAILDASDALLQRYGYRKMTMEDIAKETGIAKATIYCYFPSKEAVVLSTIDRLNSRLHEHLNQIADSSAPPSVVLTQMLLERVLFRFDAIQCHENSLDELLAALRIPMRARKHAYIEAEGAIFARILEQGKQAGVFHFTEVEATVCALFTATNALMPYSLARCDLGTRADVERKTRGVISLLIRGLEHPAA